MKDRIRRPVIIISFFLLFSTFLSGYLSINLWDYDFWWHISTGRYILENGGLPEKDPFSYTSALEENKNPFPERESFILKQYWLGQIVFYLIYKAYGSAGIIIFRALVFLAAGFFILWHLKRNNVSFYLCFLFVFLSLHTFLSFTAERPVLLTMLFSIVVFSLLEDFRHRRSKSVFLLVPMMLLWANVHGGFLLGTAITGGFVAGETLSLAFKKSAYTKKELYVFYSACVLAIAITYFNPNHFSAIAIIASPKSEAIRAHIQEHLPTFFLYKNSLRRPDAGYIALLALFPVVFISRIKKTSISHMIVLSGLLLMSIISFRFVVYFVLIGAVISGTELHNLLELLFKKGFSAKNLNRITAAFAGMIFLSSVVFFADNVKFGGFNWGEAARKSVPVRSVDFIEKNRLPGNIYNDFVFGGYVAWRLYPWKKTFIDTRSINPIVLQEARWINSAKKSLKINEAPAGRPALWERLLDHYGVDIVLLDTLNVHGSVIPLVFSLLKSNGWAPVTTDAISVVFLRNNPNNSDTISKNRLPEETVFNAIITRAAHGALNNKINPNYLVSIGDVFYAMDRKAEALKAYEYALNRFPANNLIRLKMENIKRER